MTILINRSIPSNNCLAFQTSDHPFQSILHTQFEFEIVYIQAGYGNIQYSDQQKPYSAGDLIILGPNTPHQYFNDRETIHSLSILFNHNLLALNFFDHALTKDILEFLKIASSGLIFREFNQHEALDLIGKIIQTSQLEQALYLILLLNKLTGTTTLESFNVKNDFQEQKRNYARMQNILNYINHNAHRQLFIDELADQFNMSRNHFSKFFNQNSSLSFSQYLLSIRVERACKLLANTDKSITEIALDVGFESISTFNRAFQRIKTQTPTQFRQ